MPEGNINAEVAEHLREHGAHDEHDEQTAHQAQPAAHRDHRDPRGDPARHRGDRDRPQRLPGGALGRRERQGVRHVLPPAHRGQRAPQLTANQTLIYNAGNFTAWLQAYDAGDESLQKLLERRFTPEYKEAFDAWVAIDGMNDPSAPPGPRYMPEYEDPLAEKAAEQNKEASHAFDLGVEYRETGERYVRVTVILAAVLFLIAIGQRFKIRGVRYAVNIVAGVFLVYAMFLFFIYPHLWGGA